MLATSDASGYIISAVITGAFAVIIVILQIRANARLRRQVVDVHEEVRTNHGVRQGQRIEDLSEDVAFIRRTMVTKRELNDHTEQDSTHFQEVRELIQRENLSGD